MTPSSAARLIRVRWSIWLAKTNFSSFPRWLSQRFVKRLQIVPPRNSVKWAHGGPERDDIYACVPSQFYGLQDHPLVVIPIEENILPLNYQRCYASLPAMFHELFHVVVCLGEGGPALILIHRMIIDSID